MILGGVPINVARPPKMVAKLNGIRVRDWVAALADYRAVDDVICNSCAAGQFVGGP